MSAKKQKQIDMVVKMFRAGIPQAEIARLMNLSRQRIFTIIKTHGKDENIKVS